MWVASTFFYRIDRLSESVGTGHIVAGCKVNQPYAQNQHQSDRFRHPHGGRSHYLGGPLLENALQLVREIATVTITPFGSLISQRMIEIAETMARYVLENAPHSSIEDPGGPGVLALSGNPWVEDKGVRIYDRPPLSPRELD